MIDYFIILDRWGNIVHRREKIMPIESGAGAWDGRLNGEEMNPGVYTYSASVTFSNSIRLVYSGDVTLIR